MMSSTAKDQLAIKFRLNDSSDIGPRNFPSVTSVAALKENIVAQWPKGYTTLATNYQNMILFEIASDLEVNNLCDALVMLAFVPQ